MNDELIARLNALARAPVLLVASDYDGTLAPIVADPMDARPDREAMVALSRLGALSQTEVAVISGRSLRDLAEMTDAPDHVHLVGSHGSEFDPDFAQRLPGEARELRDHLLNGLATLAERDPGFGLEEKPASIAFHFRNADPARADEAIAMIEQGLASLDGVETRHGKKVIELSVVTTNKGTALEQIRRRMGASAVLFMGDDRTDEDGFATLMGPDVGIKIGDGETSAEFRLPDPRSASQVLVQLCELRSAWLSGSDAVPIEKHAMLSDQRTIALVTPDARIVWCCMPRIDSAAIFAELLGGPMAGHFTVAPCDGSAGIEQRYVGDSMAIETRFPTFSVTDYLDCSEGRPTQRPGRTDLMRVVQGEGRVRIEFAPRLDFGRTPTRLTVRDHGLEIDDTLDPIVLRAPGIEFEIIEEGNHERAVAEVELNDDEPLVLEMRFGTGDLRDAQVTESRRRRTTARFWEGWVQTLRLPSVEPAMVRRSALVLRALCHGPTGAIVAAGTTSLPEHIGGVRNWDYRFCWLRDAAMSAHALVRLGSNGEAMSYLDWVLDVVDGCPSPDRLRPLYTVNGTDLQSEAEIGELAGYAGSRPVRIGNAASAQVQLDVFGPIVDLVWELHQSGAPLSSEHWRLVEAMVSAVEKRWSEPDHGIWEIRAPRRHHVHSKVMCWLTVDRAIRLASDFLGRTRDDWAALRSAIERDVLDLGFHKDRNAFTTAYEFEEVDAAVLLIGMTGLLEPTDPRFVATVEAVEQDLREGPTVRRYHVDDGLPGREGGFHLCTSWLIDSYVKVGRIDDARSLFNDLLELIGPTGLLPEEYDHEIRRSLGNHPQAYSHLGLIGNALTLQSV